MSQLIPLITTDDPTQRNRALADAVRGLSLAELLAECTALDAFRRTSENLYERVRALFFLHAIYRFHLPPRLQPRSADAVGSVGDEAGEAIPFVGYQNLLQRRFGEAIDTFLAKQQSTGGIPTDALASALAEAYHALAFQTLADQVRRSVRSAAGNQWMFRIGHPADQPLRIRRELIPQPGQPAPILHESTPVRMDLTHSGWSDIFFLGMDFPEGARVLNVSIDLAVKNPSPTLPPGGREPLVGQTSSSQRDQLPHNSPSPAAGQGTEGVAPPIDTYLRVIDRPVLRLTSVDLGATAEITTLAEVFDFARDYLGLIKAAVIAAGIVPPGMEGAQQPLADLLARLVGPGQGLEIVSQVNGIPKGSRLAVSTNLLASLIALLMRATGQSRNLTGELSEDARRVVAARAILGEWIGGSGGGWQDSGGVWPGMKLIEGVEAAAGDPEHGVSRGRLLPRHTILNRDRVGDLTREKLQQSLVLVHGGMAQDVGPILEMVTEKYLLRSSDEWRGRQEALRVIDEIVDHLEAGDVAAVGAATHRNFDGPIQTIIPWASNFYTESIIKQVRAEFGSDFWGFWMLGGMAGGGMGFIFEPSRKAEAQVRLQRIMSETKARLQDAVPFAMEPVVYDFAINEHGTFADLQRPESEKNGGLLPAGYYTLIVPALLRAGQHGLSPQQRDELDRFGRASRSDPALVQSLFDRLVPSAEESVDSEQSLGALLERFGFDRTQHEQIRADLRSGRIGLAQNRLPPRVQIEDVQPGDVDDVTGLRQESGRSTSPPLREPVVNESGEAPSPLRRGGLGERSGVPPGATLSRAEISGGNGMDRAGSLSQRDWATLQATGKQALANGEVAVVTLAGGAGSRWTQGAGVVKALNPFAKIDGAHRSFVEVHLAKSRRTNRKFNAALPHIFTTSYLTHEPIARYLEQVDHYGYPDNLLRLSPGRSIGLRLIPTARDLRFAWEEQPQQLLDEQAQKVQESLHGALIGWAQSMGEGSDYVDNLPTQCLHPTGHWYEVPNLLLNGTLASLLAARPQLRTLLLHNIDTLGAHVDPALLGLHRQHVDDGAALTFEVISRRLDDRGGGLARVDGALRLVEGLALPDERTEFRLSYYNSNTTWIDIDRLLSLFGLTREELRDEARVADAVRALAARMPTYITLKEVKKRWGKGQEDVFPVTQFEKLWVDMTLLPETQSRFVAVPRVRGQQLKEVAQLDGWLRDGSAEYLRSLCAWGD